MAIHKLTDLKIRAKIREIEELAFSTPKNALLGDGQGLTLAIAKNGSASWLFRATLNKPSKISAQTWMTQFFGLLCLSRGPFGQFAGR